ncbi:MAG: type II secretion system F family protein [Methylobacter sp.]|nr:type II secretion system F family protein [Methylobacter sp.]
MSKTNPPLNAGQLATLFTQLKHLESAGLPTFQAFAVLAKLKPELKKPLAKMQQQLKSGRPISEAGFRAGIFNDTHKTLIHAAETSGRLTEVYGQLADYYTGLASRIKKVKSRLYFPALTLIIALFVQPLPDLIGSKITGFDYLLLSLGRLVFIGLTVFLLVRVPMILRSVGLEVAWHRLLMGTPAVAKWIIKRQLNQFFFILAMMLESGLAFAEALPKAVAGIKNGCLREQFNPALSMCASGASVSDTLTKVSVINATMRHIVNSSEQSGKLAGGILHFYRLETETIGLQDDALAEWLPRLVYSVIAAWMAYSILGSQFATVVPNNI